MLARMLVVTVIMPLIAWAQDAQDLNRALLRAAEAGDTEVVASLLAKGAGINTKSSVDDTPLSLAAFRGHRATVEALLANGADINAGGPLLEALREGRVFGKKTFECTSCLAVAELLIEKGADVNATNGVGDAPLHIASSYGQTSIVTQLLAKGANVNGKGYVQSTPLHNATRGGHLPIVEQLLAKGADVNAKDRSGARPLDEAMADYAKGDRVGVAQVLIAKGADITVTDKTGKTLLHIAAANDLRPVVGSLLARQVTHVNAKDKFGNTALHYAAKNARLAVAEMLLAKGADVNRQNTFGKTPFDLAKDDAMTKLLAKSAKVRSVGKPPEPLGRMEGLWSMNISFDDLGPRKGSFGFGMSLGNSLPTSQQNIKRSDPDTISFTFDGYTAALTRLKTGDYGIKVASAATTLIDGVTLQYSAQESFLISSEDEKEEIPFVRIRLEGLDKQQWIIKCESPNQNYTSRHYSIVFTKP